MLQVREVTMADREFWFRLDRHLAAEEFERKVRDGQGYVLTEAGEPVGLLRYNLFWDGIPFCTLLFVDDAHQQRGYGRMLMAHWEQKMKQKGYGLVLVSTQVDEQAQHFYRKLGYKDCGCLVLDAPGYEQPMEMFLSKAL